MFLVLMLPGAARDTCPVSATCSPGGVLYQTAPSTDSFGPAPVPFPMIVISLEQFDPNIYAALHAVPVDWIQLEGLELSFQATVHEVSVYIDNLSSFSCSVNWIQDLALLVNANPAAGSPEFDLTVFLQDSATLPPSNGSPPPPWDYEWLLSSTGPIVNNQCFGETSAATLADWTGNGVLDFDVDSAGAYSDGTSCGSVMKSLGNLCEVRLSVVYLYCVGPPEPGAGYCSGDPGSGTPCPCSNDNDGSIPGAGCANGLYASGSFLTGSGTASLANDTLVLHGHHTEDDQFGLYFQADNDLSPGIVWGDGLRCAGGDLRRLGTRLADGTGYSNTSGYSNPISVLAGNVSPGDTKCYQLWYRAPLSSLCGQFFNASNGYKITWQP